LYALRWAARIKIHFHVHDELDFSVKDEWVPFVVPYILHLMKCDDIVKGFLNWPVSFECDVEYGGSWAVPCKYEKIAWKGIKSLEGFNQKAFTGLFDHISKGGEYTAEEYRKVFLPMIYTRWEKMGYEDPYRSRCEKTAQLVRAFQAWRSKPENKYAWPTPETLASVPLS